MLQNVAQEVLHNTDANIHGIWIKSGELDKADGEEARGDAREVNTPLLAVAVVEFLAGGFVDCVNSGCFATLCGCKIFQSAGILAGKRGGVGV